MMTSSDMSMSMPTDMSGSPMTSDMGMGVKRLQWTLVTIDTLTSPVSR